MLNARVEARSLVTERGAGQLLHSVTSASQLQPSRLKRSQEDTRHSVKVSMLSMFMEEHGLPEA